MMFVPKVAQMRHPSLRTYRHFLGPIKQNDYLFWKHVAKKN